MVSPSYGKDNVGNYFSVDTCKPQWPTFYFSVNLGPRLQSINQSNFITVSPV